jgi:tetratricopeptide (TPR) repeat protein
LLGALLREPWRNWRRNRARALIERGQAAFARGEPEIARRACEEALAGDPGNIVGHYLLGSVDAQAGRYDTAKHYLERCVTLGAQFPEAYIHLGNVYRLTGDLARASQSYRKAVHIDPHNALAHYNLGVSLKAEGAIEEALEQLAHAQAPSEIRGEVVRLRAKTLVELGRYEEAARVARTAVDEDPQCYDSCIALGYTYQKLHQPHEALKYYERALKARSNDAELFNNYGIVLQDLGRLSEAIASYEAALRINPADALARFHKALANLLGRNYVDGWADYETRLLSTEHPPRPTRFVRWEGENVETRTIVAYGEQGLGDEIMFASCLPDLIRASRHCMIECSPKLRAIFCRSFPNATVYVSGPERQLPTQITGQQIDFEVPLGSLPLYFRRSSSQFPQHHGYLKADPARVALWRKKLDLLGPGPKVGFSWKGGTYKTRNPVRSIPLQRWLPTLKCPTANFVSLQYTPDAAAEIETLAQSHGITITHWQDAIDDYDETAALVCALDVVVTVCTSIVHLAGALGRPVWVAAPHVPEWRYGMEGDTMPWYPSARLFRQHQYGDWEKVIERMSEQVRQLAASTVAPC